ncbi:AMP-binding protein [Kangiella sp. M94]
MNEAVEKLHNLLQAPHNYWVAYDAEHAYSHSQFIHDVHLCMAHINHYPHHTYLLFVEHSYSFAVNFIALLMLQKDIVLTANNKPEWIAQIDTHYDAIIGETSLNPLVSGDQFVNTKLNETVNNLILPEVLTSKVLFFTSGSTSKPKLITKSITHILMEVGAIDRLFGESVANCQFLATVSHHHIYGLIFRLLWPLIYRHSFYSRIVLYQEQLADLCRDNPDICLISSPAFLSRQDTNLDSISLKTCFSSGSLLSQQAAQLAHQQLGVFPVEVYGSTETGGIGYRQQSNLNQQWTLFPGIHICQPTNQPSILSSPYLEQDIALDDEIELLDNQHFKLLGRKDRVVKIEEKRVSLNAIEHTLNASPLIEEAKIVVLQHHRTFLGAVVVLSEEGRQFLETRQKQSLNRLFKSQLAETYEAVAIPRKWRYLDDLPLNSQGKLPLDELKALF